MIGRALALVLAGLACLAGPAMAQDDVAAFYRGKQVRFVVGTAPGGAYDLFARIVARHMAAHIPGQPTIVVQNLPAAGGLVMTNQLYALGPKDGTVIGVPINGIPTMPLIQCGVCALTEAQPRPPIPCTSPRSMARLICGVPA